MESLGLAMVAVLAVLAKELDGMRRLHALAENGYALHGPHGLLKASQGPLLHATASNGPHGLFW